MEKASEIGEKYNYGFGPNLLQPKVDLDKEVEEYWIATGWSKVMTLGKFQVIARYFYGLGQLNAVKEGSK